MNHNSVNILTAFAQTGDVIQDYRKYRYGTEGTESYEDTQMDVVSGKAIDMEMLEYYLEITGNKKALAVISESFRFQNNRL